MMKLHSSSCQPYTMRLTVNSLKLTLVAVAACAFMLSPAHFGDRAAHASVDSRERAFTPNVPLGLPTELWRKRIPADNPLTVDKVAVGRSTSTNDCRPMGL